MVLVAPSILSADFASLREEIQAVEKAGADWIHIDVMDGHFVPNLTLGPPIVKSIRKTTDLVFDVHLMITNPEEYADQFIKAGADILTFHIETVDDPRSLITDIKQQDCKVGITLNPDTSFDTIADFVADVDLILIMTVYPGFSGQSFIPDAALKLKEAKEKIDQLEHTVFLEVDGGINDKTATIVKQYGANVLVAGSFVFGSRDYKNAINMLKQE